MNGAVVGGGAPARMIDDPGGFAVDPGFEGFRYRDEIDPTVLILAGKVVGPCFTAAVLEPDRC